ncbi:S1/P1 nuclease [Haloferula sargassicola]|uniref:S1/P1 Nuclease n=1 Tax=Haloferula sargassicola TaxID=490096 RepID=A0ABP9URT3_9BACT
MKLRALAAFLFLAVPLTAYDDLGHETVGAIAERELEGTRALAEARALLAEGETLATAATWADRIKAPVETLDPEGAAYVEAHPQHGTYHYCDVPFQQGAYRLGMAGTRPDDIIQTLKIAIEVLRTPANQRGNPLGIDKRTALRLVAHLVGDLHQPLHVGCSYVSGENEFVDPIAGRQGQDDAGGNDFHLGDREGMRLHAYWDVIAVAKAGEHLGTDDLPGALMKRSPVQAAWNPSGPIETWPEQWADDTLAFSPKCFAGIELHERFLIPATERRPEEHYEWVVTLPDGYEARARDIVELELPKAGYRLALLLKAIWPDELPGA